MVIVTVFPVILTSIKKSISSGPPPLMGKWPYCYVLPPTPSKKQ